MIALEDWNFPAPANAHKLDVQRERERERALLQRLVAAFLVFLLRERKLCLERKEVGKVPFAAS